MGGMFGGGGGMHTEETRIGSMQIQTSAYGGVEPWIRGTQRITGNLAWYNDFTATPHTETTSAGGKGGGVDTTNTSYTYTAAVLLGLCMGPVATIKTVWRDKEKILGSCAIETQVENGKTVAVSVWRTAADNAGLTLFNGDIGQPIWSYLTAHHPDQAIPYSGLAYLASSSFSLDSSAGVQNHSFEVEMPSAFSDQIPDADPSEFIPEFLAEAGLPTDRLGDMSAYASYVRSAGLFLSPALKEQEDAAAILTRWLQCTNSEVVWSENKLKFVPYGDEAFAGNGASYTPNLTPVYDLTDDDFIGGDDPVVVKRGNTADAYNHVQIEYLDRANDYNTAIAEAKDQANIEAFGLRSMPAITMHEICDADIARHVAQLILQRELYIRNTYEFKLGWRHCLLEPMDLVTITDSALGLSAYPVRIVEIEEDESGLLSVTAEDWPFGVASATKYPHQYADSFSMDMNSPAGTCADPVVFETSAEVFGGRQNLLIATAGQSSIWGGAEVWLSLDDANYKRIGRISGPSRYGVLTSEYKLGPTPDASGTVSVDMSLSGGKLLGGTTSDADAGATLCWLDGELIAYRDAALVAESQYDLGYLVRGLYDTPVKSHAAGAKFVRLDETVFAWEYPDSLIGRRVSIKLVAFNCFGGGSDDLSAVEAVQHVLLGKGKAGSESAGSGTSASFDANITLSYDSAGNVIISFNKIDDPSIKLWELRSGDDFESGNVLAQTTDRFFLIPLTSVIGKKLWIKALYSSGTYSAKAYSCSFSSDTLPAISGVSIKVSEPLIDVSWPAVSGADHYILYWEEGGVTTVRVVTDPRASFPIPKYSTNLRLYAVNTKGGNSKPFDQSIGISGRYNLNEIVNIPLSMTTGQYINMAFTSSSQVEKVSLLGPSSFTTPIASPNNAGCYTFGYNLKDVSGATLQNTPGEWFRQDFWQDQGGFFESAPVDLGQILSGRLKLQLTKTVTAYGSGAGSAFAKVLGEYMAESTGQDLTDNKAFLSAQFYVGDAMAGPWVPANDGDWVTACRYVKIVVSAEHVSPLTDCLVTAGALTLDVPDMTETGVKTGVTSAGATVVLNKTGWHAISLVLLTPKGNAKVWPSNPQVSSGIAQITINTDSTAGVDVGYFIKGY